MPLEKNVGVFSPKFGILYRLYLNFGGLLVEKSVGTIFTHKSEPIIPMNIKSALIKLYYLLVHADSELNEREIAIGNQMIKAEGIPENDFNSTLDQLKKRTEANIYTESVEELRKLDHKSQLRCVAWLCVVANADGFMDKMEWQFIYKIYHKELGLSLDEIMKVQKELVALTFKRPQTFSSIL